MKLLVCALNYAPDLIGAAKYTTEMCEWLAARGHTVTVITAPPYYPQWSIPKPYTGYKYLSERRNDVRVLRCPLYVPVDPKGGARLLHHASFALSSAPSIVSEAARVRPDLILAIAPSILMAPAVLWAGRLCRIPAWLHVLDIEIDAGFKLQLAGRSSLLKAALSVEKKILAGFERISTVSSKMAAVLESKGASPIQAIFPNWVDTSLIKPEKESRFRQLLGIAPGSTVALYSGSLGIKHGLDVVLQAARLLNGMRDDITVVLCGTGPQGEDLKRDASPNVRFLDLQPAELLSELLSTADIHLLPQRAEVADLVLPSKLTGMFASGRAVIAMCAPGTQMASDIADAGLIVSPGDPMGLVRAIVTLADDPELRRSLGQNARSIAESRFERHLILTRLEAALCGGCAAAG